MTYLGVSFGPFLGLIRVYPPVQFLFFYFHRQQTMCVNGFHSETNEIEQMPKKPEQNHKQKPNCIENSFENFL